VTFDATGTAGAATKLTITTQPSSSAQNAIVFGQQPAIQLRDGPGNAVSQAGVPVTVAIASGGGSLGVTTTVNTTANGLATFTNLRITDQVGNHTLTFTSGSLTPATSGIIDLDAGTATTIAASAGDGQTAGCRYRCCGTTEGSGHRCERESGQR
jgi:adhesin/invasin